MTTPAIPIIEVLRLEGAVYQQIAASFGPPTVTDKTTDIQAGYQLGVQAVLAVLRHGFVIGGR